MSFLSDFFLIAKALLAAVLSASLLSAIGDGDDSDFGGLS